MSPIFFQLVYYLLQLPFFLGTFIVFIYKKIASTLKLIVRLVGLYGKFFITVIDSIFLAVLHSCIVLYQSCIWFANVVIVTSSFLIYVITTSCILLYNFLTKPNEYGVSLALLLLVGVFAGLLTSFTVVGWKYIEQQPYPKTVADFSQTSSIQVYDRSNVLLYEAYTEPAQLATQSSPFLNLATVAIQDDTFYTNDGVDWHYVLTSLFGDTKNTSPTVITHQLAHTFLKTKDNTIQQLLKEIILSLKLEEAYTKDQLLQLFLATSPIGSTVGAENAAQKYFLTSTNSLTDAQVIYLLALLKTTSTPTKLIDQSQVQDHYNQVLEQLESKNITSQQILELAQMPTTQPAATRIRAVNAVQLALIDFEETNTSTVSKTVIYSSIDSAYQTKLQQLILAHSITDSKQIPNITVLIIDKRTGQPVAITGSQISSETLKKLVLSTQEYRQPSANNTKDTVAKNIATASTSSAVIAVFIDSTDTHNYQITLYQVLDAVTNQIRSEENSNKT